MPMKVPSSVPAPPDAAVFVHADADKLWSGPIGKAVRGADEKLFAELTAKGKDLFGITPDQVDTVTAFWPKFKGPRDPESFALVLAFKNAYDPKKILAGFDKLFTGDKRPRIVTASDRLLVLLFDLDEIYAKPQPAGQTGPLTATLREAANGKHLLSYGTTIANLKRYAAGSAHVSKLKGGFVLADAVPQIIFVLGPKFGWKHEPFIIARHRLITMQPLHQNQI